MRALLKKFMLKKEDSTVNFGKRMSELRKAAGFTQLDLANELGISRRMVAYYEGQTEHPPAKLLPSLAKVLGITTDEMLGVKAITKKGKMGSSALQRRLQQIEKLGTKEKRQIIQLLDTFIEREEFKKKAQ